MSSSPCTAYSWTTGRQKHCNYKSHLKLFYKAGDRGAWSIGSKLILKDRSPSLPTFEVPSEHTLILMRRIPGEPLSKVWSKLSTDEKERIAKQTAEYLQQLHNLQSDKIQSLGGRPAFSNFLFKNKDSKPSQGLLASGSNLWADMERGLKETIPEAARVRRQHCMPSAMPYTFTHGDLTNVNIMVENGSLTGILDWEMSGYFPVYEEDREWKALLRKYMPDYGVAREFWLGYYYLRRDLYSERAMKFMKKKKIRNETHEGGV
ncbi:hypothetical protein P170DRAFT_452329 [Aspergillus steynii IBT 23096]|uniref:Aminoglycoside phosphotransferase domain-containing protein n=1 Tax=Aspergillus steynii IBT 23096 TaxID=1392250 RepID=A0A2I2GNY9_9EURO|nr:uncharacterized protein P170DRAFT_452329 [Aspergillus steynii IBT 23096]PLB54596.1 hypothetical protein P170DRAFT_452329 [Aspergillus steynii IBT 23096]